MDAETALKTQAELQKLTNRSSSLMIARELVFRLSELSVNSSITTADGKKLLKKTITQSKELITEKAKPEVSKSTSEIQKKKQWRHRFQNRDG